MIEKLKNSPLNLQATSVYNFNEFSLTELLNKFFTSINECIDSSNQALNFLVWLKGEGLPQETIKELNNMYVDGRLTKIIDDMAGNLDNKIVELNNNVNNKINENINNVNIKVNENMEEMRTIVANKGEKVYITPEEFGAIGDGVTDDSIALQNAIDYAVENKILLTSKGNKTYGISTSLDLFTRNGLLMIDFNFSKIKALNSMMYIFRWKQLDELERSHYIRNIKLDCANLSAKGIYCEYIRQGTIENIEIRDAMEINIELVKGSTKLSKGYFVRTRFDITYTEVIGIKVNATSTDSKFEMVYMRDIKFPIVDIGGACYYSRVHAWLETPQLVEGSIYGQFSNKADLVQCYFDTFEICIKKTSSNALVLTNCQCFINMNFYTSTKTPIIFHVDSGYNLAMIVLNGCMFSGYPYFKEKGINAIYTNVEIADMNYQLNKGGNRFNNLDNLPPVMFNSTIELTTTDTTTTTNILTFNDKALTIDLELTINSESGFNNSAYEKTIGKFPITHRPKERDTPYYVTGCLFDVNGVFMGNCTIKITSVKNGNHNIIIMPLGETLKSARKLVFSTSLLADLKEI